MAKVSAEDVAVRYVRVLSRKLLETKEELSRIDAERRRLLHVIITLKVFGLYDSLSETLFSAGDGARLWSRLPEREARNVLGVFPLYHSKKLLESAVLKLSGRERVFIGTIVRELESGNISASLKKLSSRVRKEEVKKSIELLAQRLECIETSLNSFLKLLVSEEKALVGSVKTLRELFEEEELLEERLVRSLRGDVPASALSGSTGLRAFLLSIALSLNVLASGCQAIMTKFDPLYSQVSKYSSEDAQSLSDEEKQFEEEFGINLQGEFTWQDILSLRTFLLWRRSIEQVRAVGIKTITILPRADASLVDYGGAALPQFLPFKPEGGGITLRFFSGKISHRTVVHEFAHALTFRNAVLISSWERLKPPYGKNLRLAHGFFNKLSNIGCSWTHIQGDGPFYGFASAYGASNIYEDIATFVEYSMTQNAWFLQCTDSFDLYRKKLELLLSAGMIDAEVYYMILQEVEIAERQFLSLQECSVEQLRELVETSTNEGNVSILFHVRVKYRDRLDFLNDGVIGWCQWIASGISQGVAPTSLELNSLPVNDYSGVAYTLKAVNPSERHAEIDAYVRSWEEWNPGMPVPALPRGIIVLKFKTS